MLSRQGGKEGKGGLLAAARRPQDAGIYALFSLTKEKITASISGRWKKKRDGRKEGGRLSSSVLRKCFYERVGRLPSLGQKEGLPPVEIKEDNLCRHT